MTTTKRVTHRRPMESRSEGLIGDLITTPGLELAVEWTPGHAREAVTAFDAAAAKVRAEIIDAEEGE